jgi:hypothetical protein
MNISILPAAAFALAASLAPPPAIADCGRLSVFDVAPRNQQIYPAVVIAINGRHPGPGHTFRLPVGMQRVIVAESIDHRQFNQLERVLRDRPRRDRYKEMLIDIQPNVTYRLGARLHPEQRGEIRSNTYWDPVIWLEKAETCR